MSSGKDVRSTSIPARTEHSIIHVNPTGKRGGGESGVGTRIHKVWGIPATGICDELFRKAKLLGIGDGAVEREVDYLRARELVSLVEIVGKLIV